MSPETFNSEKLIGRINKMYWIVLYDERLFKTRGVLPYMGHIGMCRCEGFFKLHG